MMKMRKERRATICIEQNRMTIQSAFLLTKLKTRALFAGLFSMSNLFAIGF